MKPDRVVPAALSAVSGPVRAVAMPRGIANPRPVLP
jgi:hypothetical protein